MLAEPLALRWAQRSDALRPPAGSQDQSSTAASCARGGAADVGKRGTIVVVTCRFDPHADAVTTALDALGVAVLRLNSEDLLTAHPMVWRSDDSEHLFVGSEGAQDSIPIGHGTIAGYYRTPSRAAFPPEIRCAAGQIFSASEGDAFLDCLYALEGIRWFPPPNLIRPAEAKVPQLQLAKRLGLRIPRTIVTNDPVEARAFIRELGCDIAVKPLMTAGVADGDTCYEIYAQRISPDQLDEHIESIRWAPTILQEYIPKATELRVTVIGSDIFAVEIDSQSISASAVDWRQVDPFAIPHRPTTLPPALVSLLRRFLQSYGLTFGAIDLIRTPDGEYVFLENNPNGQWYWLEVMTGLPMAASMARLLTRNDENA